MISSMIVTESRSGCRTFEIHANIIPGSRFIANERSTRIDARSLRLLTVHALFVMDDGRVDRRTDGQRTPSADGSATSQVTSPCVASGHTRCFLPSLMTWSRTTHLTSFTFRWHRARAPWEKRGAHLIVRVPKFASLSCSVNLSLPASLCPAPSLPASLSFFRRKPACAPDYAHNHPFT